MGFEIDFLPVGDESKSGDAVAMRYGNLYGARHEQTVMVVDGGYTASGEALVEHIERHYGTSRVDYVVSTHPDQDHVCGLKVVLEQLEVGELWMHLPWNHSQDYRTLRASGFKSARFSEKVERSLDGASELEELAKQKGILIREPFTGLTTADGGFIVLGPTQEYYEELLDQIQERTAVTALSSLLKRLGEAVSKMIPETMWLETLTDGGETSPQNNSSVIGLLAVDGQASLLTADAGMPALERVANLLDGLQVANLLDFVQVPHHGSRRNIGPTVLDRLLGERNGGIQRGVAVVSAAVKGEPKHPAKKVTNAFARRGYDVHATQGTGKWHRHNAPVRAGYSTSVPIPFHGMVEEDDD